MGSDFKLTFKLNQVKNAKKLNNFILLSQIQIINAFYNSFQSTVNARSHSFHFFPNKRNAGSLMHTVENVKVPVRILNAIFPTACFSSLKTAVN